MKYGFGPFSLIECACLDELDIAIRWPAGDNMAPAHAAEAPFKSLAACNGSIYEHLKSDTGERDAPLGYHQIPRVCRTAVLLAGVTVAVDDGNRLHIGFVADCTAETSPLDLRHIGFLEFR